MVRWMAIMKSWRCSLPLALLIGTSPLSPALPTVALGDSLTFAYEASFGFEINIPFQGSIGDGFGPEVRNWMEILRDPAYRGDRFDFGDRDEINISIPFLLNETLLFRHGFNWSIPGLRVGELRAFMEGDFTFEDLLSSVPEFATLIEFSDLDPETAFDLADLEDQIRDSAGRLVFFIGGNDLRGAYGAIYGGGDPEDFISGYIADASAILERVQELNPSLPVVVVNVPHIGITPDVKSVFPTDEVATGRVTAAVRELNRRLEGLADELGYGYADVFTPTLPLLGDAPYSIQGIAFANEGSVSGDLDFIWLNGEISANFHPNTHGQAVIANAVIDAFNARYDTGIAPLTATEILGGLLGRSAAEIDMPFGNWAASYGLPGLSPDEDADGDGIPAGVEFALGLSPILRDGQRLRSGIRETDDGTVLEIAYPVRLPGSARVSVSPVSATDPTDEFTPITPTPEPGADGLARGGLQVEPGGRGFLRLKVDVGP